MTASRRVEKALSDCEHLWHGICPGCCEKAILAHAQAVREEDAQAIHDLPVIHRIGLTPLCDKDQAEGVIRARKVN